MGTDPDSGGGTSSGGWRRGYYTLVTKMPWLFATVLPVIFIALMSAGYTREDFVEEKVGEIWTKTSGDLYDDKQYLKALEANPKYTGRGGITVFLAMARAREEGANLFTNSSLHEIVQRMKDTEATVVSYNDVNYTWPDICAKNSIEPGTTYKWPCIRLSAMDLFLESRWAFDDTPGARELHYEKVTGEVVGPRIQRMGSLSECRLKPEPVPECVHAFNMRSSAAYAVANGQDANYANPLLLLADIKHWEASDPCKMCVEGHYAASIDGLYQLYAGIFGLIASNATYYADIIATTNDQDIKDILGDVDKVKLLHGGVTLASVEEFYKYYIERLLYSKFGIEGYKTGYTGLKAALCPDITSCTFDIPTIDEATGTQHLLNHADNKFSDVNTAGSPFPWWDTEDADRYLFGSAKTGPFGGSGLDLSGSFTTDVMNAAEVVVDPGFMWFLAGHTPMTSACKNDAMPHSNTGDLVLDGTTSGIVDYKLTQQWCTPYNIGGVQTKQHYAKMWYDLLVSSKQFLNIVEGTSDPYSWTSGEGCPYDLSESRFSFTDQPDDAILGNSSIRLYSLDEGVTIGPVDRNILLGNTVPAIGQYNKNVPLTSVGSIQTLYLASVPNRIVDRVKNCNRPGGPIDISEADAEEVLYRFKEKFEENWSENWDTDIGAVQFVGLFDDTGATGTTGRLLKELTLSGTQLMIISFVVIFLFSAALLSSRDVVQSRVLLTAAGVILVILSFFAALGVVILIGIKFNITIGWTLPFLLIGLGVDSMYIVILALKNLGGRTTEGFIDTMSEVFVPITMTSFVNCSMFAIMNLSNIPAVFETAQAAMMCIASLWLTIVVCFPAYCYLDLKRQQAGGYDVVPCLKKINYVQPTAIDNENVVYTKIYKACFLKPGIVRYISMFVVFVIAATLLGIGIWGITEIDVGLGLEDLFPNDSSVGEWAKFRTKDLASWPVSMNWGDANYTNYKVQMKLVSQFEKVVNTTHVTDKDTEFLWMADFATWTTRHCDSNFAKQDSLTGECGHDYGCIGTWAPNEYELRLKVTDTESCGIGGYCLEKNDIHPSDFAELPIEFNSSKTEYCPVFYDWTEDKLKECVRRWRMYNDAKGDLLTVKGNATQFEECAGEYNADGAIVSPIPVSSSPSLFGIDLFSHDDTLDLIRETRTHCDDDNEVRCWMTGIPYDYWEQYLDVFELLTTLSIATVAVGFGVSTIFLFLDIVSDSKHSLCKVIVGSISGGALIGSMCALSIVIVIGLSSLLNVNLTAFSVMSFVLSVGFVVEYAVHIVHRFLMAPTNLDSALSRVEHAMSFLFVPTFMSFVSSTIGVGFLGITKFEFNQVFFFRPLLIVMFITYFCGCYVLPLLLSLMNFDFLKLGDDVPDSPDDPDKEKDVELAKPDKVVKL